MCTTLWSCSTSKKYGTKLCLVFLARASGSAGSADQSMPVCRMSARLFRHVLPLALALLTSGHLTAAFVVVKQSLPAMTVHDFGSISACGRRRSSALRSLIDSASEAHLQASVSNEQDIMPSIDARTIERAFDEADKSKTGKLGIWELDQVLTDLGYSTPDEKNDIFAVLDFSRDGLVSRKEFCENMSGSEEENEFYRRLSRYLQRQSATQQDVEALIGTTRVDSDPVQGVSEVKQTTLAQPQTVSKDSWPGKVGELNTECEFDDLLDAAGETPVLVKAFAPWCRKCAALKAPYSKLARAYGDRAVFVKMSVASAELKPMIKDRLDVKQIPTFQVWKNKKLVDEYVAGKSIPAIPKRVATMLDGKRRSRESTHPPKRADTRRQILS